MQTNIFTWNPINDLYGNIKASVYIKPSLDILKLFQRAPENNVLVKIHGTDSSYDDGEVFATIDKSSDVPSFRDNFFNCYGLYVLTINRNWKGYPLENGSVEFLEGVVKEQIRYLEDDKEDEKKHDDKKHDDKKHDDKKHDDKKHDDKKEQKSVLENVRTGESFDKSSDKNGFDTVMIIGVSLMLLISIMIYYSK